MFNRDSEVYLILYAHGAGGRFMQMMLSLDPGMCSIDGMERKENLVDLYRSVLLANIDKKQFNAHTPDHIYIQSRNKEFLEYTPFTDRYVFAYHHDEPAFKSEIPFFRSCKNLRVIVIGTSQVSENAYMERLEKLRVGRNPSREISVDVYKNFVQTNLNVEPILELDTFDFWNEQKFPVIFEKFCDQHKLDCPGWLELYKIWVRNMVQIL